MSELPTEPAQHVDINYPDMAVAADDVTPVEVNLLTGVSYQDNGEAVLAADNRADEEFGELDERHAFTASADGPWSSDYYDDQPPRDETGGTGSADVPPDSGSNGRPPNKPPDGGDVDDKLPDPEEDRERQAAMAEARNLIGHIGRLTHGPQSDELRLGDGAQVTERIMSELSRGLVDSGLEPESVVGRQVTTSRQLKDLHMNTVIEAHTIKEELMPLIGELDANSKDGLIPVARLFVFLQPEADQAIELGKDSDVFASSTADVSVWVQRNLTVGAYMMADPFDQERGARVASFFEHLGLKGAAIPESDADNRLGYDKFYPDLPSQAIRQINRFARDHL